MKKALSHALPNFPPGIPVYRGVYKNWSNEINVQGILICEPNTPKDVEVLANWAHKNGKLLRLIGERHTWAPFTVENGQDPDGIVLADTKNLNIASVNKSPIPGQSTVAAQAGIRIGKLLTELHGRELDLQAVPAPPALSLGGVLALGAHGTGVPVQGEEQTPGYVYGSVSNAIRELTAVAWDDEAGEYRLKNFKRSDPECGALGVNLGRALVTDVTLQVGNRRNLRCKSDMIPINELFAPKGSGRRTLAQLIEENGAVEVIAFANAEKAWVKQFKHEEEKPEQSRMVSEPNNYPFTDNFSPSMAKFLGQSISKAGPLTPLVGKLSATVVSTGLSLTKTGDIWGASKNVLHYVQSTPELTTLPSVGSGHAVLTTRDNVQKIVNNYTDEYRYMLASFQDAEKYPLNGALDIRVTGLDDPKEVGIEHARTLLLSPFAPPSKNSKSVAKKEPDVAVMFNTVTTHTQDTNEFLQKMENWLTDYCKNKDNDATLRPELSKGWAYGPEPWTDEKFLDSLPAMLGKENVTEAKKLFERLDPHSVFSSPLSDRIFEEKGTNRANGGMPKLTSSTRSLVNARGILDNGNAQSYEKGNGSRSRGK